MGDSQVGGGGLPAPSFPPANPPQSDLIRSAPSPRAQPSGDESAQHGAAERLSPVAETVKTYQDAPPPKFEPRPPEIPRDRTKSKFSLFDKISKPLANEPKKEGSDKEAAEKERVDKNRKQQERKEKKEKKERDKKEKKDKKDKERADKKAKETPVKEQQSKSKRGIVSMLVPKKDRVVANPAPASTPSAVPPITPIAAASQPEQQHSSRRPRSHRGNAGVDQITRSPRVISTSPRHADRQDLTASQRMRRPAEDGHVRIHDRGTGTSGKRRELRRSGMGEKDRERHDSQMRLQRLLQSKGLGQYVFVFEERRIGYEQLIRMDAADLRELPLPPAARKRLHDEIQHINGVPITSGDQDHLPSKSPRHSAHIRRSAMTPRANEELPERTRAKSTGLLERLDSMSPQLLQEQQLAVTENYREQVSRLEASVAQWKQKYTDAAEVNQKLDKFIRDHFTAYNNFLKQQEEEYQKALTNASSAPSTALSLSSSAHSGSALQPLSHQPARMGLSPSNSRLVAPPLPPPAVNVAPIPSPGSNNLAPPASTVSMTANGNAPSSGAPENSPALPRSPSKENATAQSAPLGSVSSNERLASALMQFRLNNNSTNNLLTGDKIQRPRARCLYDYSADNQKELSFKAGDVLTILNQDQSGWWLAFLHGKSGFVPRNYLQVLPAAQP